MPHDIVTKTKLPEKQHMDGDNQISLPSSAKNSDYRRTLSPQLQVNKGPVSDPDDDIDAAHTDRDKRKARLWTIIRDRGRRTYGEMEEELTTIE